MKTIDLAKIYIGKYITVYDQEGLVIPEILNVFDRTPCAQDGWFVAD